MSKLRPKQERFVEEYLADLNATQAAIRAGYSPRTARQVGHENLSKPDIAAAICEAKKTRSKRTEITQDRVLEELARIAFSNVGDYLKVGENGILALDLAGVDDEAMGAIAEVTQDTLINASKGKAASVRRTRVKTHPKLQALRLLAEHLGMIGNARTGDAGHQDPGFVPLHERLRIYEIEEEMAREAELRGANGQPSKRDTPPR
jgi:phage terminase small subunit